MAANLTLLTVAVGALFGTFMLALAYAQWSTRGIEVYRADQSHDR
ncbi:hypothetical protein [Devosia sp.]|nr:hypothetical protein [Devosia sp.]